MYMFHITMISYRGNGVHPSPSWRGFDHLIHHWAPQVLDFMSTPHATVTEMHQLTLPQWCIMDLAIMGLLSLGCCGLETASGPLKGHLQPGLMFPNPVMHSTCGGLLHGSQQKVNWQTWLLPEHQKVGGFPGH